jgi:energy-coupling factor transport system permease protein
MPLFTFDGAHGRAWLAELDPRVKLAGMAWVSTASLLLDTTAALVALVGLSLLAVAGLKLGPKAWLLAALLLAATVWGTIASQALFYAGAPRTVLFTLLPPAEVLGWHWPGLAVYREGVWHGLAQSLRMLAVALAGLAVCLSTSPERLLAALLRLRAPTAIGFMAVAAIRFLPTLIAEWGQVHQARRLRGAAGGWWIANQAAVLRPVLASALRRATALATSVSSRGFDPAARRTFYPPLVLRTGERFLLAGLLATLLALVVVKGLYWLYLGELVYRPGLRPLYDFARRWL